MPQQNTPSSPAPLPFGSNGHGEDQAAEGESAERPHGNARPALCCACLALATALLFGRALQNDFAELDDNAYVTANEHVQQGLSRESLVWATTAVVGGNWHPLTMLSHMLDCQLFGLAPWGHHLSGILWHAANVGLCGWIWWRMTGQLIASLAVAALFGWHPLRVESVAWVAERKDVLSTFFGLAAIAAYAAWTDRRGWWRYALVIVCMALSLLAKPMLVTLPCVLLLLDFWPLRRVMPAQDSRRVNWPCLGWLVAEKAPLLALSAAFCAVTVRTQSEQGVRTLENLPVIWRLANTAVAYAEYLGQTLWPAGLAVFYPHPANRLPLDYAAICAATLAVLTWQALRLRERLPSLAVGWLWYLGTLVPVIGLVQVGGAARADRYTYVPSIGIAAAVAFAGAAWGADRVGRRRLLIAALAVWLTVQAGLTWRQIGFWRDPAVLFERTVAVTGPNFFAQYVLGTLRMAQHDYSGAVGRFDLSLEAKPDYSEAMMGKAYCQKQLGQLDEARQTYLDAIRAGNTRPAVRIDLGYLLLRLGKLAEAERQFQELLRENPDLAEATLALGITAARRGRPAEAAQWYQLALHGETTQMAALDRWARLLALHPNAKLRRPQEPLPLLEQACRGPAANDPQMWETWALALGAAGQFSQAVDTAEQALELLDQMEDEKRRDRLQATFQSNLAKLRQRQVEWEDPTQTELPIGY